MAFKQHDKIIRRTQPLKNIYKITEENLRSGSIISLHTNLIRFKETEWLIGIEIQFSQHYIPRNFSQLILMIEIFSSKSIFLEQVYSKMILMFAVISYSKQSVSLLVAKKTLFSRPKISSQPNEGQTQTQKSRLTNDSFQLIFVSQPFMRQPHRMVKHTQAIRRQFAYELFECV